MKNLASLLLAGALFAGSPNPAVESAIKAAETALTKAMVSADLAALDKLLADDLMYTHSDTRLETKKDVIQGLKDGSTKLAAIDLRDSTYRQYGDTVLATHKATVDNALTKQKLDLYVTYVWVKTNGAWRLANRQSTRLPAK
jgi:ketosteroid isomerase-like protein